jgi:hypothetical protein
LPRHRPLLVGEKGESGAELRSKTFVRLGLVDTYRENLRVRFFELGSTILVRPKLVRSGGSVGENKERQDDVLLAQEIGKPDGAPVLVG